MGCKFMEDKWRAKLLFSKKLNSRNVCYHPVQSILSCRFLSRNLKIKIHKTIIISVVLYGCETWSLIV